MVEGIAFYALYKADDFRLFDFPLFVISFLPKNVDFIKKN